MAGPDLATLVPDPALRVRLFPAVGRPGVALDRGRIAGLWRARRKGALLELAPEWTGGPVPLGDAQEALARLRGCDRVCVA